MGAVAMRRFSFGFSPLHVSALAVSFHAASLSGPESIGRSLLLSPGASRVSDRTLVVATCWPPKALRPGTNVGRPKQVVPALFVGPELIRVTKCWSTSEELRRSRRGPNLWR